MLTCTDSIIGQWGPIVGTALAIIGSLYILIAQAIVEEQQNLAGQTPIPPCTCQHHGCDNEGEILQRRSTTATAPDSIRKIAKVFMRFSNHLGTPAFERFDDSEFRRGRATDYPEIPGETGRNRNLSRIRTQYSETRVSESNDASRSRAGSGTGSIRSARSASGGAEELPSPTSPVTPRRRDTLEVPTNVHLSNTRDQSSGPEMIQVSPQPEASSEMHPESHRISQSERRNRRQSGRSGQLPPAPTIVVADADDTSPVNTPIEEPLSPPGASPGLRFPSPTATLPPR